MLLLKDCPKRYTADLDKACPPEETVSRVLELFGSREGILAETRRIDTGRLGIPVFLSTCGPRAREVMPTRKQMGKGASPEQAEASALMELVERFSYFSFWAQDSNFDTMTWSEAKKRYGSSLMDIQEILKSVGENLSEEQAEQILDCVAWKFCTVYNVSKDREEVVPLDWFKKLNEFNGSSAGNTFEEAILQGGCELIERHVSALADRDNPVLPTLDPESFHDPVLCSLWKCFRDNGIQVVLKDFSMGFPAPTVGALAWDPKSFPQLSEIVFTAGTATSPSKAAVRALTEIAQLAGDFETGSNYEASGLAKYTTLEQIQWILEGERIPVESLPSIEQENLYGELTSLAGRLQEMGFSLYAAETTHGELNIPACYNFVPGFLFRERTPHACLGLFVGRILAEEYPPAEARAAMEVIQNIYPDGHFLPFFHGLIHLREGEYHQAEQSFQEAQTRQKSTEDEALACFYAGYALTNQERWEEAVTHLDAAIALDPGVHEFFNLRGVAGYKCGNYQKAAADFQAALALDGGSALDYANLGLCYQGMGKAGMARDFLTLALEIEPNLEVAKKCLQELSQSNT
ncbi:MAG: tetratricopeptide repeat protein [Desulfovibrionales bacterium]